MPDEADTRDSGNAPLADAHALSADDVASRLGVDPGIGLSTTTAEERRVAAGPNSLTETSREPVWRMVLESATEPFILLLLGAGILAVVLGEVRDGLLILLALVPIVGADVVTEYRGERALEALRDVTAPLARVRRSGQVVEVAAASLVPGDIVLLRTGDVVPADLRLKRAEGLLIDRSALTGESIPEPGRAGADPKDAPLAERLSVAFAGTSVVGGRGEGIVVATGDATEVGRLAGSLSDTQTRRSPVQRELDRLVRILLVVAIGLIAIVTGAGFLRGRTVGENLLAGISAAIAAIPEEPPLLLAVILGLGAYRLLKRRVLVRRLNAEETLGAVDLIVTDKTGTLTRNRLEISSIRDLDGPISNAARRTALLTDALRAEDDAWHHGDGLPAGPFTQAIWGELDRLASRPILSPDDLLTALAAGDGVTVARTQARRNGRIEELALGAPEAVLALAFDETGDEATGRTEHQADASRWRSLADSAALGGERLLLLARRDNLEAPDDDRGWATEGLIGFADVLRDGVSDALQMARRAGIQTVVVTGDHPLTARAIAEASGLDFDRVVTGDEIAHWSDERLAHELGELHVVARSTPEQKKRIVEAARADGRVVAVTGDGVNDAPALHRADVGVSMGSGTAVAREASDLVLGDDAFATLVFGIAEGRRIVDNIQKGLLFLLTTHVALLGFILIATLAGFDQPLLPIQILWLELFIDLSTSVAFELEPPEPDLMIRPPRPAREPLLSDELLGRIVLAGGYSAVAALLLLANHGGGFEHARWLAFTGLVVGQAVRAYANRSIRESILRLRPNWFLLATSLTVIAIQTAIPYVPGVAEAFRATPLDAVDWALVAVVAFLPATLAEVIRSARPGTTWVA